MSGTTISLFGLEKRDRSNKGKNLLIFPSEYVVIDLETTGLDPRIDEIIEIAGVKYSEDKEIDRFQSLVNPGFKIDQFITDLTGITNEMLQSAPMLSSVLPEFFSFVGDNIVIGHNINFDINFIYDNAENLSLPDFSNDFVDTMRLSRRLYKDMDNHKLSSLVSYLDVSKEVDHRALSDCIKTNSCFLIMKNYVKENNLSLKTDWKQYNSLSKLIKAETDTFNPDSPIFGRSFAFTGKLERMTRKEAMQAVLNAGGTCCDGVIATTNYLVLGNNDYCKAIKGGKSNKQKKAEKMQLSGSDIVTISEDTFYDMLLS